MDILLDKSFLGVSVVNIEEKENPSKDVIITENLEDPAVISQMLAQTIVSSFTYKKKLPDLNSFLIPLIGVNRTHTIFYMYDSEHDVLLRSPAIPFLVNGDVNIICVLSTWFVINYQYLCSGIPINSFDDVKKANFFEMAESHLPIYQNDLSVDGGVGNSYQIDNHYDPSLLTRCQIVTGSDII